MGIQVESLKNLTGSWSFAAKNCDSCKTAAAAAFCRADSAFLCLNCDNKIHAPMSRHERVWICEVCEQAPAAVTCKADAAALCITCDADIHSANPLARRHERVPVELFFDSAESIVKSSSTYNLLLSNQQNGVAGHDENGHVVENVSWLLPNQQLLNSKLNVEDHPDGKYGENNTFFSDQMDPFLDFEYHSPVDGRFQEQSHSGGGAAATDRVVPVQSKQANIKPLIKHETCFDIDYFRSKLSSFSYPTQSLSHSVSSSDVGVVPDGNCMSDISYPFGRNASNSGDPGVSLSGNVGGSQGNQLCGVNREARVLRYKEKRKNRKFEKTIRYASRKAYAERRPRIKGRFARRSDAEPDLEGLYNDSSRKSAAFMAEAQYGVVPSF